MPALESTPRCFRGGWLEREAVDRVCLPGMLFEQAAIRAGAVGLRSLPLDGARRQLHARSELLLTPSRNIAKYF